jgi:hypothetical protein
MSNVEMIRAALARGETLWTELDLERAIAQADRESAELWKMVAIILGLILLGSTLGVSI